MKQGSGEHERYVLPGEGARTSEKDDPGQGKENGPCQTVCESPQKGTEVHGIKDVGKDEQVE